jgi:SAM-dependent methyltransferase
MAAPPTVVVGTELREGWAVAWEMVDEGWGRRAVDFATLSEPSACREYVAVQHRLGVGAGDRLLDVACGSGLAVELATLRGATCAGIDASSRLVAVAKDRNPRSDIRVGDMEALPWDRDTFDVVTSFRGIWGTTRTAVEEAHRVLLRGGRLAITVWGNVGKSPGAWMMAPFRWATDEKVQHQADMVSLGRPGVGETFLDECGFDVAPRFEIPFVFEFPDPETFARGLASTGPAYEAIQSIGEDEFVNRATELAASHVREGLALRGQIQLFGYIGTKR